MVFIVFVLECSSFCNRFVYSMCVVFVCACVCVLVCKVSRVVCLCD